MGRGWKIQPQLPEVMLLKHARARSGPRYDTDVFFIAMDPTGDRLVG